MSRSFCMEHKNQKSKRVIKSHAYTIGTSTPKTGVAFTKLNISLSDIGSATSSSSESRKSLRSKLSESIMTRNQERNLKEKKRVNEKQRMHFSTQSTKSITMSEDSEWETIEEKINESSANSRESTQKKSDNIECIKLFQDSSCTPEMTREGPIAFESAYESPIIRSLAERLYLKKDIIQRDDLLPINLPQMEKRDRPEEMDEDEIVLHRESNVKTYLTAREIRKKHNLLWCQIVESNGWGPITEFLASTPPPPRRPFTDRNVYPELSAFQNLKTKVSGQLYESDEDNPVSPGMMRVRGSLDRNTRRWTRTYEYGPMINKHKKINKGKQIKKCKRINKGKQKEQNDPQSNERDEYDKTDDETTAPHGKRMTFTQFRQSKKQKMMNKSFASFSTLKN